jgi:hypothetical protein
MEDNFMSIFKPKWKNRDEGKALKGLEQQSDSKTLVEVTRESEHPSVRIAAVKKLSDPESLRIIARENMHMDVANEAAMRISDQKHLLDIALHSKHAGIAAVEKLSIQEDILLVALTANDEETAKTAVKRLTNREHIYQVATRSRNGAAQIFALSKLNDEGLHAIVVLTDLDKNVRLAAVKMLQDPVKLSIIISGNTDSDIRIAAVNNISDQETLKQIANNDADSKVRLAATVKIKQLFDEIMKPIINSSGALLYDEKNENAKEQVLKQILENGETGERYLLDFLTRDALVKDGYFLLNHYGDAAHAKWLDKAQIVRALVVIKSDVVVERLGTFLLCMGKENDFAIVFQSALANILGLLGAYEILEKFVDSKQRVPAVMLAKDYLRLHSLGIDQNACNRRDIYGIAPLIDAAEKGDQPRVNTLLDEGADINIIRGDSNDLGQTALYCAAVRNNKELVRMLLSRGADPNIADLYGLFPLQRAAAMGLYEIAELLLKAKANVKQTTLTGKTALAWAIQNKHLDIAQLLGKYGA